MTQEELSKEDQKRILKCDYYTQTKNILRSHESYRDINVGEVYLIKYKRYVSDEEFTYINRAHNGVKDKFMIFHKDEDGFIFAKRINADGKLGKEVHCLTTQYPGPKYQLEPDPEYLDSILFSNEEGYDPIKAEKEFNKKKGQARRKNKQLEFAYETAQEAFAFISSLKVGDKIYDAKTAYGQGICEWTVISVESRPTCNKKVIPRWGSPRVGSSPEDVAHNGSALPDFYKIEVEVKHERPACRRWGRMKRTLIFSDFMKNGYVQWYPRTPYTTDDV